MTLQEAISTFGAKAKSKLSNPSASGAPEDQLRAPLEGLIANLAELTGLPPGSVVAVGESSLADLKTRPDYAVTRRNALIGFIEVKAPGKGADPRRFQDTHDKEQWAKLKTLPNLIYTDGNGFSLWRDGELVGTVVHMEGDVATAGNKLAAPDRLVSLFADFFQWEPQPPRSAAQLAVVTARLCRLLREEVVEQLGQESAPLTNLATDWRKLLFPSATDEAFADGYAQAVTFGLLMARARDITLADGLDRAAHELRQTNTLIGRTIPRCGVGSDAVGAWGTWVVGCSPSANLAGVPRFHPRGAAAQDLGFRREVALGGAYVSAGVLALTKRPTALCPRSGQAGVAALRERGSRRRRPRAVARSAVLPMRHCRSRSCG